MNVLEQCWEWHGSRNERGYGRKHFDKRAFYVHRLAWEWTNGPIPDGLMVLHRCDNPPCCNPGHLFLGTNLDNVRDRDAKGRNGFARKTHCKRGHSFSEHGRVYRYFRTGRSTRKCIKCVAERNRKRYLGENSCA